MFVLELKQAALWFSIVAVSALTIGCSQNNPSSATAVAEASQEKVDDHSGWWCAEHGVPEEQCSICNSKAAANFKENGDWCEEHHRDESQCFLCNPARAEKFAKLYEAKFGHAPPEPGK